MGEGNLYEGNVDESNLKWKGLICFFGILSFLRFIIICKVFFYDYMYLYGIIYFDC